MDEAVRDYLRSLGPRGLTASTVCCYRSRLLFWLRFCDWQQIREVTSVSPATIDRFFSYLSTRYRRRTAYRRGQGLTPKGRAEIGQQVKAFFAFLAREGRILLSPVDSTSLPRIPPPGLPRFVTSEEMTRIEKALDPRCALALRDRALVEVLFGCGLRRAEAAALDLFDLDLASYHLWVRAGKGGMSRAVPLAGHAHRAVVAYLEKGRPELVSARSGSAVFLSWRGRRLSGPVLGDTIAKLMRRVPGVDRLSPHAFRHGYATALLRGGATVREVQLLLGHRVLDSSERYTHLDLTDLTDVYRRTHPRERGPGESGR